MPSLYFKYDLANLSLLFSLLDPDQTRAYYLNIDWNNLLDDKWLFRINILYSIWSNWLDWLIGHKLEFILPTIDHLTCTTCGRSYTNRRNYYRHKRYGCGRDPMFSCCVCNLRFSRRDNMKAHQARQHPDIPYHVWNTNLSENVNENSIKYSSIVICICGKRIKTCFVFI